MSEPHQSKAAAQEALGVFLTEVQALREKHRIADFILLAGVNFAKEDGALLALMQSVARGSPDVAAQLGIQAFKTYTQPMFERIDRMKELVLAPLTQSPGIVPDEDPEEG
jgi:hypothetical protein